MLMNDGYELSDRCRRNLERLARYLESLPEHYEHFKMDDFVDVNAVEEFAEGCGQPFHTLIRQYMRYNGLVQETCGSSACAVGHGPSAGMVVPEWLMQAPQPSYRSVGTELSYIWVAYAAAMFIDNEDTVHDFTGRFQFMFGGDWPDNTWLAAARIRYFLANEEIDTSADVIDYSKYVQKRRKPLPKNWKDWKPEEVPQEVQERCIAYLS